MVDSFGPKYIGFLANKHNRQRSSDGFVSILKKI